MATGVEYVRQLCKERGIKISRLEKDLGFGNGYFNPKKLTKIPMEKAILIADYLKCDIEPLLQDGIKKTILIRRPDFKAIEKTAFDSEEEYYSYKDSQILAREVFEDDDLHALLDAARGCSPKDLKMARDLLRRLKETNPDG